MFLSRAVVVTLLLLFPLAHAASSGYQACVTKVPTAYVCMGYGYTTPLQPSHEAACHAYAQAAGVRDVVLPHPSGLYCYVPGTYLGTGNIFGWTCGETPQSCPSPQIDLSSNPTAPACVDLPTYQSFTSAEWDALAATGGWTTQKAADAACQKALAVAGKGAAAIVAAVGSAQNDAKNFSCNVDAAGATNTTAGTNPCNPGTGNKYQAETDYVGQGTYPLTLTRAYNSGAGSLSEWYASEWGNRCLGSYNRSISSVLRYPNMQIGGVTVQRPDGRQFYFNLVGNALVGDVDVVGQLTRTGVDVNGNATGWTYRNENDETETYDAAGKLISLANAAGQRQTLTYSDGQSGVMLDFNGAPSSSGLPAGKLIRVTDPAGRTLKFDYDLAGRVAALTDPAGQVTRYTYASTSANDNLVGVTRPDGKTRNYLYGESANVSATPNTGVSYTHALTGLVDENGVRYASWTYDAAGRAASSEHGAFGSGIDHVGLSYTEPDVNGKRTTVVTDVMGVARTYNFDTLLGVVKNSGMSGQPCSGCSASLTRDPRANVTSRTDFNGNVTQYRYDAPRNLETSRTEAVGTATARTITTQWHATYRLPTRIAEPLRLTTYTYDTAGNLLSKTLQASTDATGASGVAATVSGLPRTTSYTYNTAGQVSSVDGPRTDVVDKSTYTYDAQSNLMTVTNALNQTTTLGGYDAHGQVGTLTDPNGLVINFTYDVRGRLTGRKVGSENTLYSYDGVGNLTGLTLPAGATYTYTHDAAHRLTDIADNAGNRVHYTLDAAGNRIKEEVLDATGAVIQTRRRVFDTLNRLYQDLGAVNQTTTYAYDANGNLTRITDPLARQTLYRYDALNRLNQITNPDSGLIQYGYDGQDQLTQVTDPRNLVTRYTLDGLSNLTLVNSPDTGATSASYDAAGNLLTRTDAKGQKASYTYDALNRLLSISYSGGTATAQTISYQYDQGVNGLGHLSQTVDASGTTSYAYDQNGRVNTQTVQSHGVSYLTRYSYDTQGRLASLTTPSGRVISYDFDSQGRISRVSSTLGAQASVLVSNVTYRPFGGVQSFTYGDGTTTPVQPYQRPTDSDGRIASYTLSGQVQTIGYDAASQLTSLGTARYGYDSMGRLNSSPSSSQTFNYDLVGNRTRQVAGTVTTNYGYATTSNRLSSLQTGTAAVQSITQDANGSTSADTSRQYSYDIRGRLNQTTTAQGSTTYELNAQGLRVRKQSTVSNGDTLYHYDLAGHLLGESRTGVAQLTREYIWLIDLPIAVLQ